MTLAGTALQGTAVASRAYLWIWGAMMVVLGTGGMILNPDFGTGPNVTAERLFGVFEINGWHALAGLLSGVVALAFAPSRRWASLAAVYTALVSGLIPSAIFLASGDGSTAANLIPVDYWDAITLHLVPGVIGIACALTDRVLQQRSTTYLAPAGRD